MKRRGRDGGPSASGPSKPSDSMRSWLRMSSADPSVPREFYVSSFQPTITQFCFSVPVYNAQDYFSFRPGGKRPSDLTADTLQSLPLYKGELPGNSFVAALVTPNTYTTTENKLSLGFNLYAIVLLRIGNYGG